MKWAALYPMTPRKRTTNLRRQTPKHQGNPMRRTARAKLPNKPGRQLTRNRGGQEQRAKSEQSRLSFLFALFSLLFALSRLAPFLPILVQHGPTDLFADEGIEKWATPLPIIEHLTRRKCTVLFAAQH